MYRHVPRGLLVMLWQLTPLVAAGISLTLPSFSYLLGFPTWFLARLLAKTASLLTNGNKTYSQHTEGHPTSQLDMYLKTVLFS